MNKKKNIATDDETQELIRENLRVLYYLLRVCVLFDADGQIIKLHSDYCKKLFYLLVTHRAIKETKEMGYLNDENVSLFH